MTAIFIRTAATFFTVLIAVGISTTFGESGWSKVLAAALVGVFLFAVEWALDWTPKHSAVVRKLLDPRAIMVGVWIQSVVKAVPEKSKGTQGLNSFALYWVEYRGDAYRVVGYAFDVHGIQQARWESMNEPSFTRDGTVMSYRWRGEVIGGPTDLEEIERTGVTTIEIFEDGRSGKGRLDNVGEKRILLFDIEPATKHVLSTYGFHEWAPSDLMKAACRLEFAQAYAKRNYAQTQS